MKTVLSCLLFGAVLAAQPASIEGTVVNDPDGQPLAGAHVTLISMDQVLESPQGFGAMTDRNGHFSITALPAGSYVLSAERTGYLLTQKPGAPLLRTIHVKRGQQLTAFVIRMAAHTVISGRVLDEAGDPVTDVVVHAGFTAEAVPVAVSISYGSPSSVTDDRGVFRLILPPGKYYLSSTPPDPASGNPPEIRTDGSTETAYGKTYYPNSASADQAAPLEAAAGREISGIDIRLVRRQILNVSGVVTGPGGPTTATVWLRSKETSQSHSANANGQFAFNRLEPGAYQMYAQTNARPPLQSQIVNVRLEGGDQTNVQLLVGPAGDLSGKVDLDGKPVAGNYNVRLNGVGQVVGGTSAISGGAIAADGSFELTGVPPGQYRVAINPMPDGAYLKDVLVDGVAAKHGTLDFTRGVHAAKVKITLGGDGGELSGAVRDEFGDSAPGPLSAVLLLADDDSADPDVTMVSAEGKYSFQRLRPGKYHVAAIDLVSASFIAEATMRKLAARGDLLEITGGGRIQKNLQILPSEAGDGKN